MYLSRLMLNPRSRRVQSEVRDPYQMHKTLAHGFPGLQKEQFEAARVLFRVEEDKGFWRVLVQSKIAPDWSTLEQIENYLQQPPDSKSWMPQLEIGQRLKFRLLVNPTYRASSTGPVRGAKGNAPRIGLYREAERLDWLRRQAEERGFTVPLGSITYHKIENRPVKFRGQEYDELQLNQPLVQVVDLNDGLRFALPPGTGQTAPSKTNSKPVSKPSFSAAQFDGVLTITDTAKFVSAVENGIGSAKGFGFGLLSLARA